MPAFIGNLANFPAFWYDDVYGINRFEDKGVLLCLKS